MATKDALTELLEEEVGNWEEEVKQLQDQIPVEEEEEVEDTEEVKEEEGSVEDTKSALQELQDKIDQIEKERRGLYNDLKSERRMRQEFQSQTEKLKSLEGTVQQILQQRQAATKNDEPNDLAIPFEFNDEGEAFISKDKLAAITNPLQEKIDFLQQQLQATVTSTSQEQAAQKFVNSVLSEDERYAEVFPVYQRARSWVEDAVVDFQRQNNIEGVITSGQALRYVFDKDTTADFNKQFPGVDLELIVTAEDDDYFFKRNLGKLADSLLEVEEEEPVTLDKKKEGERFRKVMQKPQGLGSSASKQGAAKNILETAEGLSSLDAIDLTDAQVEALERALLREENVGGIKF